MSITKGPWIVVTSAAGGGSDRRDIVSTGTEFSPAFVAGDILRSDANLIAAAPDLLTTLDEFISAVEGVVLEGGSVYIDRTSSGWFDRARAAIAKAKGGVQ